jgi:hypothetical protein
MGAEERWEEKLDYPDNRAMTALAKQHGGVN